MKEVENSLRKDVVGNVSETQGTRALWIAKRWWRYRPKLPYTYFLDKLDSSEVAAVVFTEDLKRLYVTMKEGFPLEYVVDVPLDPHLFEIISSSGFEVDLLQKRQIHYFLKVVIALLPGILIMWLIRESVMLLHITSSRFLYKKYNQLFDMAYAENFILPVGDVGETKSMHKEVVLRGDVWDLLDELMIYMGNPMQYYERGVQFFRGVLLSGPPGTGKTLFARTLAKETGLPFVFASCAEFTDSEKSGVARINEMFSIARRNVRISCSNFVKENHLQVANCVLPCCLERLIVFDMDSSDDMKAITVRLNGANFSYWKFAMKNFLIGKDWWDIVDGTTTKPDSKVADYLKLNKRWLLGNAKILTWINNSVENCIGVQLMKFDLAKDAWDYLGGLFKQSNFARRYQLEMDIRAAKQGELSIQEFFSYMTEIWDQLTLMDPKECTSLPAYQKLCEERKLVEFLMALRDDFEAVRGSMIHRNPLPNLSSAISELLAEETPFKTMTGIS
ncbi:hypothetical protein EZV62_006259 [Acer yangbiense]|uniref:AAA+ ATPase domain-containing protein n=1 Tax=Acer yangbiense TaxID=1000413 RepID=A0A5C7IR83_9ROSI|nr:hypothetical protein EZV62_006259 [Acer yangbiense]